LAGRSGPGRGKNTPPQIGVEGRRRRDRDAVEGGVMSVNKAILVGRLGKDPDLSYTQSGTARCRFSMATSEVYYDNNNERQEKTEWHNVVVWGKQAESAGKYLEKGREVYVEGKIETRNWDDEKTGQKRYMTEVKAQRVVFLGSKSDGHSGGQGGGRRGSGGGGRRRDDGDGGGDYDVPGQSRGGPSDDDSDIPF